VGLAVAAGCSLAQPIYMTDQDVMLPLMKHNIELNELGARVKPAVLNW
jgi:protein N-lysine methyltransferase METTL21A